MEKTKQFMLTVVVLVRLALLVLIIIIGIQITGHTMVVLQLERLD